MTCHQSAHGRSCCEILAKCRQTAHTGQSCRLRPERTGLPLPAACARAARGRAQNSLSANGVQMNHLNQLDAGNLNCSTCKHPSKMLRVPAGVCAHHHGCSKAPSTLHDEQRDPSNLSSQHDVKARSQAMPDRTRPLSILCSWHCSTARTLCKVLSASSRARRIRHLVCRASSRAKCPARRRLPAPAEPAQLHVQGPGQRVYCSSGTGA